MQGRRDAASREWVATVRLLLRMSNPERSRVMTVTTQREECTAAVGGRLLMSMELSRRQWKLGFTTGVGQRPRRRTLSTDAWDRVREELAAAKRRFRLPADAPVISCYEAGRDGFWIHRYLTSLGIENLVVDSSSIE